MPYGSYMLRHCNIGKALPILSSEAAPMWPSPAVSGETHSSARSLGVGTLTDLSYGWTIQESEGNPWWRVVSYCNILHFAIKIHLKNKIGQHEDSPTQISTDMLHIVLQHDIHN